MKFNLQSTCIDTNKWRNFQSKKKKQNYSKSVFGVAITSCSNCCYTTWYGVKQILNVCLWKGIPCCLNAQPKFVFWSCKTQVTTQTLTNQIPHVLNRRHIWWLSRPRKKLQVLESTEVSNCLCNMWAFIILLKDSTRDVLREENDFRLQHFTDVPIAIEITFNS